MESGAGIIESLNKLKCPTHNSVWLGPFEQLVGAGYSFLAAIQHGVSKRDLDRYNSRVQNNIIRHIATMFSQAGTVPDSGAYDDWFSGFYFNSAIQRVTWAGERLLLTFAAVKCVCGKSGEGAVSPPKPSWPAILEGAQSRVDHVRNDDGADLSKTRAVLDQSSVKDAEGRNTAYGRNDPLDGNKTLAMLRYDVNNRKHKIYERSVLLDHMSAGKGDNKTWHSSGADFQMALAVSAFELVCEAYEELINWNPKAAMQ